MFYCYWRLSMYGVNGRYWVWALFKVDLSMVFCMYFAFPAQCFGYWTNISTNHTSPPMFSMSWVSTGDFFFSLHDWHVLVYVSNEMSSWTEGYCPLFCFPCIRSILCSAHLDSQITHPVLIDQLSWSCGCLRLEYGGHCWTCPALKVCLWPLFHLIHLSISNHTVFLSNF